MNFLLMRLIRGVVLPAWLPYLLIAAVIGGTVWYIDYKARAQERVIVTAENVLDQKKKDDDAQKNFAERASESAAAVAALAKLHAAEVGQRDQRNDQLTTTWDTVVVVEPAKSKAPRKAGTAECWPVAVVMELRK